MGRGLWGPLRPPGGASQPRREVRLPPGMDEEVEPSRCPEEWAQLQGITRQHVAPVRGMTVPDSPALGNGAPGGTGASLGSREWGAGGSASTFSSGSDWPLTQTSAATSLGLGFPVCHRGPVAVLS